MESASPLDLSPPRIVKPRRARFTHLPIVVVDLRRSRVHVETTGEICSIDDFADLIEAGALPESIVVVYGADTLIELLDERFERSEEFQWRATLVEREAGAFTGEEPLIVESEVFSYFGFRRPNGHARGRWYHVLDPTVFSGVISVSEKPSDLLEWGVDVRDFCRDNDLPIRPTAAGLAGMLLRDPRFYPEPRRKIPKATNERARPALPGNYYRANCLLDFPYRALYADQDAAHHSVAASSTFPHPDDLDARGFFEDLRDDPWISPGDPEFDATIAEPGLFFGKLSIPIQRRRPFPHPIEELGAGARLAFFFSNEIELLEALGIRIQYLVAAWTSSEIDVGLPAYARWSLDQIAAADELRRRWIKPLLLSAYGLLAARPRKLRTVYRQGAGTEITLGSMTGRLREANSETQIPIANVIQRGIIEAEVRRRSIELAAALETTGKNVLAIYADGVLFEGDPIMLPPGWRYEGSSERLYVLDDVSIIAADDSAIVKLPGRHGPIRERLLSHYKERAGSE